jgi:hypothetical protein
MKKDICNSRRENNKHEKKYKKWIGTVGVNLGEKMRGGTCGSRQNYRRYPPGGAWCGTWYLFSQKNQQVPEYKRTISKRGHPHLLVGIRNGYPATISNIRQKWYGFLANMVRRWVPLLHTNVFCAIYQILLWRGKWVLQGMLLKVQWETKNTNHKQLWQ